MFSIKGNPADCMRSLTCSIHSSWTNTDSGKENSSITIRKSPAEPNPESGSAVMVWARGLQPAAAEPRVALWTVFNDTPQRKMCPNDIVLLKMTNLPEEMYQDNVIFAALNEYIIQTEVKNDSLCCKGCRPLA